MRNVLVIVDMQRGFIDKPGIHVPGAQNILKPITKVARICDYVISTRDWHPRNHSSFRENGGPFPTHCVAGTPGAKLHWQIDRVSDAIFSKGRNPDMDGFSAAENRAFLSCVYEEAGHNGQVIVCGVAMEYCVIETALSIRTQLGLNVAIPGSLTKFLSNEGAYKIYDRMQMAGIENFCEIKGEMIQ